MKNTSNIDVLIKKIERKFPKVNIQYKDESKLMKLLGFILFFNKNFKTTFTTTIGNTIYFPSRSFIRTKPVSSSIIIMHELVHIHDANQIGSLFFSFLYLFPQILFLFFFVMLFFNFYLALPFLLFLLPIPAYFRMKYEKRAYMASLYVMKILDKKNSFNINLKTQKEEFIKQFKNSHYYWMWPFNNLEDEFNIALMKINNNQRPFGDKIFDIIDEILN